VYLLIDRIYNAERWLVKHGVEIPGDMQAELDAMKTEAFYRRSLRNAVRDLYDGGDPGAFIDRLIYLIEEQFRRAWNEGARNVGVDPASMTAADREKLQARIDQEFNHVLDFAEAIQTAAEKEQPLESLYSRADMWAARYNEIVNAAMTNFGKQTRLRWEVGPTEHCEDCLALNGYIATAEEWDRARGRGYYPQSPQLECHGFNCRCTLNPTTSPVTPGGLPR